MDGIAPERGGVVSAAYAPWRLQKDIDNVEFNDFPCFQPTPPEDLELIGLT